MASWDFARTKIEAIRESTIDFTAFSSSLHRSLISLDTIESAIGGLIRHLNELPVRIDGEDRSGRRVLYGFEFLGDAGSIEAEWPCSGLRVDGDFERLWELIERAPKRRVHKWIEDYNELDPAARRVVNQIVATYRRT